MEEFEMTQTELILFLEMNHQKILILCGFQGL